MVETSPTQETLPPHPHETHSALRVRSMRSVFGKAAILSMALLSGNHPPAEQPPFSSKHAQRSPQHPKTAALPEEEKSFVKRSEHGISLYRNTEEISLEEWTVGNKNYDFGTVIHNATINEQIESITVTTEGNLLIHFSENNGNICIDHEDLKRIATHTEYDENGESVIEHVRYRVSLSPMSRHLYTCAQSAQSALAVVFDSAQQRPLPPLEGTCSVKVHRRIPRNQNALASIR